jgi:serine/threonine-protein kinase HipA
MKQDIYVYAHWVGMTVPQQVGILSAQQAKGKKAFSFAYDKVWLQNQSHVLLDPDLQFYSGAQYPQQKENFGLFLDSMPDTWGRTLLKRRAIHQGKSATLYDVDFLLGVFDESRMGALRFKLTPDGPFLDTQTDMAAPPWANVRDLQHAADLLENDDERWLNLLIAPGSSLGGARPKANVVDADKQLWIAKFPSKNDTLDKGAWEYVAHLLAAEAGITMSPSKIQKIIGDKHTFFTQRFDREKAKRIHFVSAMTMTGYTEERLRDQTASYLDIADFISTRGINVNENLAQLWRRLVFSIAISNTDDHLRNHGFLLTPKGWTLSPAYDLNSSTDKTGLALNIDMENNALDFDLARSVGEYFRLDQQEMDKILNEVLTSVKTWEMKASHIGIARAERALMKSAFKS